MKIGIPTKVGTLTPFEGGKCWAPLYWECVQDHGHKWDPIMTLKTSGDIGERTQMLIV